MQINTFFIEEASIKHISDISCAVVGVVALFMSESRHDSFRYNIKYDNILCLLNLKTHLSLCKCASMYVCMYSFFQFVFHIVL